MLIKNQEEVTRTVVEYPDGDQSHLETLLHEAVDRAHICGIMLEETLYKHPYFEVGGGKAKVEAAMTSLWNLYAYLKAEEEKLFRENAKADRTSSHEKESCTQPS